MDLLAWLAMGVWGGSFLAMAFGTWLVHLKRYFGKRIRNRKLTFSPSISILKPLKGNEPGLKENLESFFKLDYPNYQVLFCIDSPEDTARPVVEELLKQYPDADARLNISQIHVGENPKINNLFLSYKSARYDWILISDSNIRVPKHYLKTIVRENYSGVGIITASIVGIGAKGLGGSLEAVYLNSYLTRWMYIAQFLKNPLVMGKSMFFQRSVMEALGGLEGISGQIAEDYASSLLMRRAGKRIRLMKAPVQQYLGKFSLKDFWARHIRWGRIRRSYAPIAFLTEPLSSAMVSGGLGCFAFNYLEIIEPSVFLKWHFSFWFLHDVSLLLLNRGTFQWRHFVAWVGLELVSLPLWIQTFLSNRINWRGNILRIGQEGHVFQLDRPPFRRRRVG